MKQRLLFLMAFMLLGIIAKVQAQTIDATDIVVVYGASPFQIPKTLTPSTTVASWEYSTTNNSIADVDQDGLVTFKSSTILENPTITITAKNDQGGTIATKTIRVTIHPKNLALVVSTNPVQTKSYDGSTAATLDRNAFGFNPTDFVDSNDAGNVELNWTGITANFESKDVGNNKKVTLNKALELQGSRAFCYILTDGQPELSGNISLGNQMQNFGLNSSYSWSIGDLTKELNPTVKETNLLHQILSGADVVGISIASDNKITFTLLKEGTAVVKFLTNATGNYRGHTSEDITITVVGPTQENDFTIPQTAYEFAYGDIGKTIIPTGVKDGAAISYSVNPTTIATINSSGAITILQAGTATVTVTTAATLNYKETSKTTRLVISQKSLNISGVTVTTKSFDNSDAAELNWTNARLTGIVSGDENKVAMDYSGVSATFSDANAANNKTVYITGQVSLTGGGSADDKSGNYMLATGVADLSSLNLKGNITKASQASNLGLPGSYTIFVDEIYQLNPTPQPGGNFNYTAGGAAASFYDETTRVVKFTSLPSPATVGLTLTSTDVNGNYSNADGTVVFTVKATDDVVFENTAARTIEYGTETFLGVTAEDSQGPITSGFTYSSSNSNIVEVTNPTTGLIKIKAATGNANIRVEVAAGGSHAAKSIDVTVNASRRKVTLTGISIRNKTYDGNIQAERTGSASLTGVISPDDVGISTYPTYTFPDKNVGTAKEIVASGGTLNGADANKYIISTVTDLTADITPANQPSNLGLQTSLNFRYGDSYTFAPTIYEASTVNTAFNSNTPAVVSIDQTGKLTFNGVGTAVITVATSAKPAPTICNYNSCTATVTVTVNKGNQVITIPASINRVLSDGSFTLTPVGLDNPTFTYEAINNDDNVISVNSTTGLVTPNKEGTASVLITALETARYNEKKQTVTVIVTQTTTITTHPAPVTVCRGEPFTLSVAASGAVSYQWFKDGAPVSGATSATYTVAQSTPAHAGSYSVRVQGKEGTAPVTSNPAAVTINSETTITSGLVSRVYCQGTAATLSVTATGSTGLTYRWYKNGEDITVVNNPNPNTHTIPSISASDTALYKVVVIGMSCGSTTTAQSEARIGMAPPLSTDHPFITIPEWLPLQSDKLIVVGDSIAKKPYEGVTQYTWRFSTNPDAFQETTTTDNRNILRTSTVTPLGNGDLIVGLTHPCGNKQISKELKVAPTGLESITTPGIKAYPNPVVSGSTMTVDLGGEITGATVSIYNVTGSLMMITNLKNQISTIPVSLRPGIYMMKIAIPDGKTVHHKFIVK